MTKQTFFKKIMIFSIFITLIGCSSSNSEVWDRYNRLNNGTTPKSSKLHSRYFDINDKTDSNFIYSSSEANLK
ncbi:MAG: hypothetical protein ACI8TE_000296 [Francisella sp.]|jgi:hypothetical protein